MLTAEQEKTLLELGFRYNLLSQYWKKHYRKRGYIVVYDYSDYYDNYYDEMVKTCKEAQHDLAILREKGIV